MKVTTGVLGLCALLAAAPPAAAQPFTPGPASLPASSSAFFGIKLPVADFKRSVDYYTRFFPLKVDQVYNDHEIGLGWPEPGGGARVVLWLETCTRRTPAERQALAAKAASPIQKAMQLCEHRFKPGSGWVVIRVADVNKTAAKLRAAGYDAAVRTASVPGRPPTSLFLTSDPDGNIVEVIQAPAG